MYILIYVNVFAQTFMCVCINACINLFFKFMCVYILAVMAIHVRMYMKVCYMNECSVYMTN